MEEKLSVQTNKIKNIFVTMLESNIAVLEFQRTLTTKEEEQKGIDNWIKKSKTAIKIIKNVNHYDILISLYNSFVNGKETYFIALCNSITDKDTIAKWDKTEKGYKEFLEQERQAREDYENDLKEKKANIDFIAKAKKEGKKVEMLYKDGKIKPVIVEEQPN